MSLRSHLILLVAVFCLLIPEGLSGKQEVNFEPDYYRSLEVRVYHNNNFIRNLQKDDFEILEDDQVRKIESIYFLENSNIATIHEEKTFKVGTNKNYYVLVQAIEYDKKLGQAINLLINDYFNPQDTLTLVTPINTYRFNPDILLTKNKNQLGKELQEIMRTDIIKGGREYNSALRDLKSITRSISRFGGESGGADFDLENEGNSINYNFGIEYLLTHYKESLAKLDELRLVDQNKFVQFAESLKKAGDNNVVIFFYQKEFRPEINPNSLNQLMSIYQDLTHVVETLMELFQFYRRETRLDKELISQSLADAGAIFNFIYLDKKPQRISGVIMNEQSEDVFEALVEASRATGGISDNTSNPIEGLKKAAQNISTYYLIFYQSDSQPGASDFRQIKVRIKTGPHFLIRHRLGYFLT